MNWLNYHHLYYFKQVVDHGSIIKASEFLKIGSPSISMQIKALEEQLKTPLFQRKNKKLILTETGQIAHRYAVQIFSLGNELLNTINDKGTHHIKIQIGVEGSVPKNLISKLTSFIYQNFQAEISVFDGDLEQTTLGIINHRLDIALLKNRPIIRDKSILYSKKILESPIVLAGAKHFLFLKNKPLTAYTDIPFILPTPNSTLRQSVEYYFNHQDVALNMVGEADDTIVQKNMAISGNGVIPIMKDAIDYYLKTKELYILKEIPSIKDEIWLVSGKRNLANPISDFLIKNFSFSISKSPKLSVDL